jgi:hypothetical protein
MTPAEVVIDCFGGIRATARVVNVNASTVCRWMQARSRGGTGGMVPPEYGEVLLDTAIRMRKLLTAEHLIRGKPGIERRVIRRL